MPNFFFDNGQRANERTLRKIYLAEISEESTLDPNDLQNQLDNAEFQLRLKKQRNQKY